MTTHPLDKPQQGAKRGHLYNCVHPDLFVCLRVRHDCTPGLAALMGGCNCPCHHSTNGVPIPYGAWVAPGHSEPLSVLHAIRLERIEEQEDAGWLL